MCHFLFSSDSESESRVQDLRSLGSGTESSWGTDLNTKGELGYFILCMENRGAPTTLVMQK
jgi:hypothetical protein